MTNWSKCWHSQVSKMQSYSSFTKPASYPLILRFSSLICIQSSAAAAQVKSLEHSWNNPRDSILVHVCIAFVDFFQSKDWFLVKMEDYQFFSIRFVFRGYIFDLYRCLNEECIPVWFAEMCMQHICYAFHISTFDGISTKYNFQMQIVA